MVVFIIIIRVSNILGRSSLPFARGSLHAQHSRGRARNTSAQFIELPEARSHYIPLFFVARCLSAFGVEELGANGNFVAVEVRGD